jgi:hypothetical protein
MSEVQYCNSGANEESNALVSESSYCVYIMWERKYSCVLWIGGRIDSNVCVTVLYSLQTSFVADN